MSKLNLDAGFLHDHDVNKSPTLNCSGGCFNEV